jgi:predicted Rossmann fold flavoprotein
LSNFAELAGVSIDSIATSNDASFRENILFTHTGLSGPAILQASLYWKPGDTIYLNFLPELNVSDWLKDKRAAGTKVLLKNLLGEVLPKRFAERFAPLYLPNDPIAELSDAKIDQIADRLHGWRFKPGGSVGYAKAEVTRGGVDTDELSSKTMEAKKVPGLYFIGEVVDVTGQLGGYNFQWAWSSGFAAAQHV